MQRANAIFALLIDWTCACTLPATFAIMKDLASRASESRGTTLSKLIRFVFCYLGLSSRRHKQERNTCGHNIRLQSRIISSIMMMKNSELIGQGAEARLYKGLYLGKTCLMKERFLKNYRHPELDTRLTKDRIRAEARAIIRAKSAGKNARRIEICDR